MWAGKGGGGAGQEGVIWAGKGDGVRAGNEKQCRSYEPPPTHTSPRVNTAACSPLSAPAPPSRHHI